MKILLHSSQDLLKDNGILVCPTFHHAADFPQLSFFEYDATIYCAFANLMYLPSTHIPLGLNEDGIPIGIQVNKLVIFQPKLYVNYNDYNNNYKILYFFVSYFYTYKSTYDYLSGNISVVSRSHLFSCCQRTGERVWWLGTPKLKFYTSTSM